MVVQERDKGLMESQIHKYFGDNAQCQYAEEIAVGDGITLHTAIVDTSSVTNDIGDKAFLSTYELDENDLAIQVAFIFEEDEQIHCHELHIIDYHPVYFRQIGVTDIHEIGNGGIENLVFDIDSLSETAVKKLFSLRRKTGIQDLIKKQESALVLLKKCLNAHKSASQSNQLPACSFLTNNTERDKVQKAANIIRENLDKTFTIKELSKMVFMNECYLKKGFKALFDKTIHEYHQQERIEYARHLLAQNDYSILEISEKLGFSSPSHFSNVFRKATGMKPCEMLK